MFRRLYIVSNPVDRTVRAWHGHKIESKLVKVLKGKFLVCTVKIDNWDNPDKNALIDEIEMIKIREYFIYPQDMQMVHKLPR